VDSRGRSGTQVGNSALHLGSGSGQILPPDSELPLGYHRLRRTVPRVEPAHRPQPRARFLRAQIPACAIGRSLLSPKRITVSDTLSARSGVSVKLSTGLQNSDHFDPPHLKNQVMAVAKALANGLFHVLTGLRSIRRGSGR